MEISRKTDYALRMMAALTAHPEEILSVRQAAKDNDIPYSFARSIQHDLVRAELIDSIRGSHGGMKLIIDPKEATLLDIVEAVQGPIQIATCDSAGENGGPCPRMAGCGFNPIWRGACMMLNDYFSSVTLYDIVHGVKGPNLPEKYWSEDAFSDIKTLAKEDLD